MSDATWEESLEAHVQSDTLPPEGDLPGDAVNDRRRLPSKVERNHVSLVGTDIAQDARHEDWFSSKLLRGRELDELPAPSWLIGDLLQADSLAMIYGPSGAGKTFMVLGWALSVATGTAWFGRDMRPGSVLYVAAEGAAGVQGRQRAWLTHHNQHDATRLEWFPQAIDLLDERHVGRVVSHVADGRHALVVFDTLHRCTPGAEENSAKDAGLTIEALDMIRRESGACVLVVHHSGKNLASGARGSSALRAAMDTEIELSGDPAGMRMAVSKQKNWPEAPPTHYRLEEVGESAVVVSHALNTAADARLEDCLVMLAELDDGNGASYTSWKNAVMEALGLSAATFDRIKGSASRASLISQDGPRQPWTLTEQGKQRISDRFPSQPSASLKDALKEERQPPGLPFPHTPL